MRDFREQHPEYELDLRDVERIQNQSYTGLTVSRMGAPVGVTLNLHTAFRALEDGIRYEEIFEKLCTQVGDAFEHTPELDIQRITDYSYMKDKLTMQVISADLNHDMLRSIPHERMENLAVVYRFSMPAESGEAVTSLLITDSILKGMRVSEEQMKADAAFYAPKKNPARIRNMYEVLSDMTNGMYPPVPSALWVASNERGFQGASVIAYPGFLEEASEKLGGNYFILPSSVHEVILVKDDCGMRAEELTDMVQTVNASEVPAEDVLSEEAYHYDAETKTFERAADYEARMEAQEHASAKMDVLVVNPGDYPQKAQIGTDIESLQAVVHGLIEVVYPFKDDVAVVLNDSGKIEGLPLNRALRDEHGEIYDVIAGPFFVCGVEEDHFISLTSEQIKKYEQHFHQPEAFIRLGKDVVAAPVPDELVKHKADDIMEKTAERVAKNSEMMH